jgi:hypothetical protein
MSGLASINPVPCPLQIAFDVVDIGFEKPFAWLIG